MSSFSHSSPSSILLFYEIPSSTISRCQQCGHCAIIDYRAYEIERRELWYDVFPDEVAQLHQAGFVHRELKRPSELDGLAFDNILLTENGLRLIDVGIYALGTQVGERIFARYLETEQIEMIQFRNYSLNR